MQRLKLNHTQFFHHRQEARRFSRLLEQHNVPINSPIHDHQHKQSAFDPWALSTGSVNTGPTDPSSDPVLALAELARCLRDHAPAIKPSAEFSATLRQRLLSEKLPAPELQRPAPARQQPWGFAWNHRKRWAAAALLGVALTGTAGTAMASETALPGQPLYPVKRTLEDMRVALAWDEATKGKLYVAQASERLNEAESLAQAPDGASNPVLQQTVQDLLQAAQASSQQAQQASPEQAAQTRNELSTFIQQATPRLDALKDTVSAQPSLAHSLEALKQSAAPTPPATPAQPPTTGSTDSPSRPPVVLPPVLTPSPPPKPAEPSQPPVSDPAPPTPAPAAPGLATPRPTTAGPAEPTAPAQPSPAQPSLTPPPEQPGPVPSEPPVKEPAPTTGPVEPSNTGPPDHSNPPPDTSERPTTSGIESSSGENNSNANNLATSSFGAPQS